MLAPTFKMSGIWQPIPGLDHPVHTLDQWQTAYAQNMTELDYTAWVDYMRENPEEPEPDDDEFLQLSH